MDAPMVSDMMDRMRNDVIGKGLLAWTPYGRRIVTYADYTASGRMLGLVEDYLRRHVYPWYANVHTDVNICGSQTNRFFSDAREMMGQAVGAPLDEYSVIFTGSGMTGAVSKLAYLLGLKHEKHSKKASWTKVFGKKRSRGVVFVGPYEHHSNEVFWREMNCDVVVIPEDKDGRVDLMELRKQLSRHAHRQFLLGCFTAGSNVTGIQTDVHELAQILHSYGALAAFDYAAAGPYVPIDCQASGVAKKKNWPGSPSLDAIMISPHKLPGGPGSCGVLVVRRSIVKAKIPHIPGGGTVQFVGRRGHTYHKEIEEREEGGTPNVIGAIRAALAFKLKLAVGPNRIHELDEALAFRAIAAWKRCPGIMLIGGDRSAYHESPRLSILSFNLLVRMPDGTGEYLLHPNFVAAVLNDVYGIQARAGCSCAGPYGQLLLQKHFSQLTGYKNFDHMWGHVGALIAAGKESLKPGWVRVNLSYILEPCEVDYIIEAVQDASRNAWKLLPQYHCDPATGIFTHFAASDVPAMQRLSAAFEVNNNNTPRADIELHSAPYAESTAFPSRQGSLLRMTSVQSSTNLSEFPCDASSQGKSGVTERAPSPHAMDSVPYRTNALSRGASFRSARRPGTPPSRGFKRSPSTQYTSRGFFGRSPREADEQQRSQDAFDVTQGSSGSFTDHTNPNAAPSPQYDIARGLQLQLGLAAGIYASAATVAREAAKHAPRLSPAEEAFAAEVEQSKFRWFLLPQEAAAALEGRRSLAMPQTALEGIHALARDDLSVVLNPSFSPRASEEQQSLTTMLSTPRTVADEAFAPYADSTVSPTVSERLFDMPIPTVVTHGLAVPNTSALMSGPEIQPARSKHDLAESWKQAQSGARKPEPTQGLFSLPMPAFESSLSGVPYDALHVTPAAEEPGDFKLRSAETWRALSPRVWKLQSAAPWNDESARGWKHESEPDADDVSAHSSIIQDPLALSMPPTLAVNL